MSKTSLALPAVAHPRIAELFRVAQEIWREREDLRATYGTITNPEFWTWIGWHGVEEYGEIARADFAWPPLHLVERVGGVSTDHRVFREGGVVDWRRMVQQLTGAGLQLDGASVLDFGCGCGRILRYFARYAGTCRFVGVDVDPTPLEWCRRELDFAEFEPIPLLPPTGLARGGFDALYSYSVFSHIPHESQLAWLEEFARVLRAGGLAVLTYHGDRAVERWIAGETPSEAPRPEQLRANLRELREKGILFFPFGFMRTPNPENVEHWQQLDRAQYGNVFLTREFIAREWTRHFAIVSHTAAPDDWQDYVVLRRL